MMDRQSDRRSVRTWSRVAATLTVVALLGACGGDDGSAVADGDSSDAATSDAGASTDALAFACPTADEAAAAYDPLLPPPADGGFSGRILELRVDTIEPGSVEAEVFHGQCTYGLEWLTDQANMTVSLVGYATPALAVEAYTDPFETEPVPGLGDEAYANEIGVSARAGSVVLAAHECSCAVMSTSTEATTALVALIISRLPAG
jgi:hypothetical protein